MYKINTEKYIMNIEQIAIGGNEDEKVYEKKRIQKKPLCDVMSIKEIHAISTGC